MLMVVHEGVVARSLTPCTARGGLASLLVRAAASTTTTATSSSTPVAFKTALLMETAILRVLVRSLEAASTTLVLRALASLGR